MSTLLITNGHLVTLDQRDQCVESGDVFIKDGTIVHVGNLQTGNLEPDRTIDAQGKVVMPGLINAHHHLYSTFARGFTPAGTPARNFTEILDKLWWKLDKALGPDDVYYSALLALMDSARAGCTTVIDHHASPSVIDGSLELIAGAEGVDGVDREGRCMAHPVAAEPVDPVRSVLAVGQGASLVLGRDPRALDALHARIIVGGDRMTFT